MSLAINGTDGIDFNLDAAKIKLGVGDDLQIYHDGSHSYVQDVGVGALYIDGSSVRFRNYANSETMAEFIGDGEVSLYHNGTKVVETNADGLFFLNGKGITLGTDSDMTIIHNDTPGGSETIFKRPVSGAVSFDFVDNDATTNIPFRIQKTEGASTNERHSMLSFGLPGVNRGIIQSGSSNSEAPALAASSDYRIKENFRAYTGGWDAIKAIPVQLYDEKSPSYWTQGADKKNMKGWKAHEVQAVIPEAVTGTKDEVVTQALIDAGNQYQQSELNQIIPQQLGTTAMLPDVIGALQQAMTKIETLEAKVAALEAA